MTTIPVTHIRPGEAQDGLNAKSNDQQREDEQWIERVAGSDVYGLMEVTS